MGYYDAVMMILAVATTVLAASVAVVSACVWALAKRLAWEAAKRKRLLRKYLPRLRQLRRDVAELDGNLDAANKVLARLTGAPAEEGVL